MGPAGGFLWKTTMDLMKMEVEEEKDKLKVGDAQMVKTAEKQENARLYMRLLTTAREGSSV